jgi:hypothetical protein
MGMYAVFFYKHVPYSYRQLSGSGYGCLYAPSSVLNTRRHVCAGKKSKKEHRQAQAEKVQKMVAAQDYRFVAQRALPMSGRSVNLTSDYDLNVGQDIISTHLPYFGRAYVALRIYGRRYQVRKQGFRLSARKREKRRMEYLYHH